MSSQSIPPERQNDQRLLVRLRKTGGSTIADLMQELGVTATAVRQRLTRLIAEGMVFRETRVQKRGRPSHCYLLTEKGQLRAGTNYADLATALWDEVRSIDEPAVRVGFLGRIANRLAKQAGPFIGSTLAERMSQLTEYMGERQIPLEVGGTKEVPTLTILACPYPKLAERDRGVCAMEKMWLSEVLGEKVNLTSCRLDGASCCVFEPSA